MLNEYLGAMTEVVFRWEGTLDKFIGDAVMAFWGAPLPQPDHAERALRCALHMCGRLDALQREVGRRRDEAARDRDRDQHRARWSSGTSAPRARRWSTR